MSDQVERSYLEISSLDELLVKNKPFSDLYLEKVNPPDFQLNKFFYKEIGKKHRWTDRLIWTDKSWTNYLDTLGVSTFVLKNNEDYIGYFESIFNKDKLDCEIAYFGILEEYIGKKLGGYFLSEAIKISFNIGSKRIWVHTCSLDHKNALQNYLSRGMKVFKSETLNL